MRGITDIEGIHVGHWTDSAAKTGCTAILCERGAVGGVDVRGAAPGTRETDLLRGYHAVERIHGVMLSGGSAFGLAAASGAMHYLEERGIGLDVGVTKVPIVPSAVLFDLAVGDGAVRPGEREGYAACAGASKDAPLRGRVGAGCGATVGKAAGMQYAMPGGIGSCCMDLGGGVYLAALAAVNALGDVCDHHTGEILAGANIDGTVVPCFSLLEAQPSFAGTNTTLGVIATNAAITREEANKLAEMAHDGFALAIRPVHTPMDGDTVFALSTAALPSVPLLKLFSLAPEVMARAIQDAVFV